MKGNVNTRTVYILLTRSETYFSRLIRLATRADYTHASIGLEGPTGPFYSFARKDPRMMLPAGLIQERMGKGFFALHPQSPCRLYELQVSEHTYRAICRRVEAMYEEKELYHYNLLGTVAAFFQVGSWKRSHHYFCSQFVAELLVDSGAAELPRPPALSRPEDFRTMAKVQQVFQGRVGTLARWAA